MNMVLPQKTPDARVAEITKLAVMAVGGPGGGVLTGRLEAMARAWPVYPSDAADEGG